MEIAVGGNRELNPTAHIATQTSKRALEPIERISEIWFGLIMVLTFTCSISVNSAGREEVHTLLIGAVGCNLEDSDHGELKDPRQHADWLSEVRALSGDALFINARVDTFLFGDGHLDDAVERARLYLAAGADCIYPLMAPLDVFPALREGIDGPLNMAAKASKESVAELARLGVTRITFGPELQRESTWALGALAADIRL